jgi:hypothetical protein
LEEGEQQALAEDVREEEECVAATMVVEMDLGALLGQQPRPCSAQIHHRCLL